MAEANLAALIQDLLNSDAAGCYYIIEDTSGDLYAQLADLMKEERAMRAKFAALGVSLEPSPTAREIQLRLGEQSHLPKETT